MAGGIVGWHFLDVESGLVPEEASLTSLPNGGRGRIVVLAATPFALSEGWGAKAAVTLAKEWAEEGLRIFLMDLELEAPTLHETLGIPNGEGVSDAFLYGASVQHIAEPVLDEAFFFASAGSRPGDPEEVLGHPRWNDLAGGFSEADATLILFLPTNIAGAGKILSRATDIVFLSAQGESVDVHLGPASIKVMAMMGPFGSPPEEAGETEAEGVEEAEPEGAPDGSEGSLDLEEGFATPPKRSDDSLGFDFAGDFALADGFGDVDVEESQGTEEEALPRMAGELDEEADEVPGEDLFASDGPLELVAEVEAESTDESSGFGDDLTMGASISGDMTFEDTGAESTSAAPDFGAEFVDLGADEEADEGEFGSDLVQGPDFGSAPSGEVEIQYDEDPSISDDEPTAKELLEAQAAARAAPKRRQPPKKKFPYGMAFSVVLLIAALGAVVGTALGYLNVPGLTFLQDFVGDVPDPPLTLAGPQANEEVLRFSLLLFTYDQEDLADAVGMMEALQSRLPEMLFVLAPGELDGDPVYSLLAGPATDRIEAEDLRAPLAPVLSREDPDSWTVRETPRAFYLGERQTLAEARDYMASFRLEGVYPYILFVTYPDGSEGYEILAGAYEGVVDARPLQLMLRSGGFRDLPLIERRGRLPE